MTCQHIPKQALFAIKNIVVGHRETLLHDKGFQEQGRSPHTQFPNIRGGHVCKRRLIAYIHLFVIFDRFLLYLIRSTSLLPIVYCVCLPGPIRRPRYMCICMLYICDVFDTIWPCVFGISLNKQTVRACPLALSLHRLAADALCHKPADHQETVLPLSAWHKARSTSPEQCQDPWGDIFVPKIWAPPHTLGVTVGATLLGLIVDACHRTSQLLPTCSLCRLRLSLCPSQFSTFFRNYTLA